MFLEEGLPCPPAEAVLGVSCEHFGCCVGTGSVGVWVEEWERACLRCVSVTEASVSGNPPVQ